MNFLLILFQENDYSKIFTFLKQRFAESLKQVSVETLVEDQLVKISWDKLDDAADVANDMTTAIPGIIIDTPSTTGIDVYSRFFNKAQLY